MFKVAANNPVVVFGLRNQGDLHKTSLLLYHKLAYIKAVLSISYTICRKLELTLSIQIVRMDIFAGPWL
jgi:hypothetical protein